MGILKLVLESERFVVRYSVFLVITYFNQATLGIPLPQGASPTLSTSGSGVPSNQPVQPVTVGQPQATPCNNTAQQSQQLIPSGRSTGVISNKLKPLNQGIFNSWLCGAGYVYNRVTKMCDSQHGFSKDGISMNSKGQPNNIPPGSRLPLSLTNAAGSVQSRSAGTRAAVVEATTPVPSAETAEYVQPENENFSHFFPLECGMNYRYLKGAKICKPKNSPVSSESDEQIIKGSSEEY